MNLVQAELSPDDPRWMAFITAHPGSAIFHHPAWIATLNECYGYRPTVLALLRGEHIVAGVPVMEVRGMLRGNRIVALPFSDHCQPLSLETRAFPVLVEQIDRFRRERGYPRAEVHWTLPRDAGTYAGSPMLLHSTELLPDEDELFGTFHRTRVRQPIHTAGREGLVTRTGDSWDEMMEFYRLHLDTRRRHGVPVQPLRFFRILGQRLIAHDLGFTILTLDGRKPVAAAVILRWKNTLTYKFNASLPEYWPRGSNQLLVWDAMRYGIERGCTRFDWGKTDPEHAGLRDFKRAWASREQRLANSILADTPAEDGMRGGTPGGTPGGASVAAKNLMAQVIKHSPRWVCRAIGEMFYGQFS